MTEPDRAGGKTRLVEIGETVAKEIESAGLGGPKLYVTESLALERGYSPTYFCEPAELERWRAARAADQAGDAHQ